MSFLKNLFTKNSKEKTKLKKDFQVLEERISGLELRINETISLFNKHNLDSSELESLEKANSILKKAINTKSKALKLLNSNKINEANSILNFLSSGTSDDTLMSLQDNKIVELDNLNNFERTIERALTQSGKILKANNIKLKNTGNFQNLSRDHTVFDLDREALLDKIKED